MTGFVTAVASRLSRLVRVGLAVLLLGGLTAAGGGATVAGDGAVLRGTSATGHTGHTGHAADPPATAGSCATDPATPKHQLRGMWIASVANIDWPSSPDLSPAAQREEYRAWLDLAEEYRLNAVYVQVRPTADAFWPSPHEPWSAYLTGTQGQHPGYDPLEFLVEETHARGIEFHAWFNPYRVATHDDLTQLAPDHPARQHPGWTFAYDGQRYYDPGVPAVRDHVVDSIMHAVTHYDIDGVHWDDYFYPYPAADEPLPDRDTFDQHGDGFDDIADWRRHNVDTLVRTVSEEIDAVRPEVAFGVSPFGIWRNQGTDPRGSATTGLQSYDALYADTRRWVREEWLDYVAPQLYWHIGHAAADYAALVPWWADVVAGTDVQLVVGQATYRAGAAGQDPAWDDPAELSDHLSLHRDHPEVVGDVHFSAKDVAADRIGAMSRLARDHYSRAALVPVRPGGQAPPAPTLTTADRTGDGVELAWQPAAGSDPARYAVYRVPGDDAPDACTFADGRHLVAVAGGTSFTDSSAPAHGTYTYYVSALDRRHHEGGVSAGAVVPGDGGGAQVVVDTTGDRFHASNAWGVSSYSSQAYGDSYRFASPVAASDPAWYRIDVPATGDYRVEVWYPSDPGYHAATPYLVQTTGALETVRVDQRTGGGQWVELGVFPLAAGDREVIGVSRWTSGSGYLIADAVRVTAV